MSACCRCQSEDCRCAELFAEADAREDAGEAIWQTRRPLTLFEMEGSR